MTKFNILDAKVGSLEVTKSLTIKDVSVETITFEKDGRTAEKLFLTCVTDDGEREFKISEAWNNTRRGKKTQGLWVQLDKENKLIANSTLARLLNYLKVEKVGDLVDKKVKGYPDNNGYIVLTTYDINEEDLKDESIFE